MTPFIPAPFLPLLGVRILSLALNLPGPAALMRCCQMGAACVKLEPPGGDPMANYSATAYAALHANVTVLRADLKSPAGQQVLHETLGQANVLITSFRPSALARLSLDWSTLQARYPGLSQVAIVGSPGQRAEEPGHDLTYLAEQGLITGLNLPATLYADMAGSLAASEAVLQAVLHQRSHGHGVRIEIALSDGAAYLALPRAWGLSQSDGIVGGAHAGYRVYRCQDGRVAIAALEPHFAARLCVAAGLQEPGLPPMLAAQTHAALAEFLLTQTCQRLDALAVEQDIPLCTLAD